MGKPQRMGAGLMVAIGVLMAGIAGYMVGSIVRSWQDESHKSGRRLPLWRNFGLSIGFAVLFFVSWIGHGVAEWQHFTDEQRAHGQPVQMGDFYTTFARATLENWQSEFLQLFSFVVMAALLMHKGSAESKDSEERMEAALHRIEKHLGLEPVTEDPLAKTGQ